MCCAHVHLLTISYVVTPTHHPGLMGLFEKRRFRDFMVAANDFSLEDPKTYKSESLVLELRYTVQQYSVLVYMSIWLPLEKSKGLSVV